jgi:hypothetical protein
MNKEYEYRIYYENETGRIKGLAHDNYPDWGEYIVVNKHEYENYFRYYVKNGKLEPVVIEQSYSNLLKKSNSGYKVVKNNANILVEDNEEYSDIEYYDYIK